MAPRGDARGEVAEVAVSSEEARTCHGRRRLPPPHERRTRAPGHRASPL